MKRIIAPSEQNAEVWEVKTGVLCSRKCDLRDKLHFIMGK
jgi:hypothetical protein